MVVGHILCFKFGLLQAEIAHSRGRLGVSGKPHSTRNISSNLILAITPGTFANG